MTRQKRHAISAGSGSRCHLHPTEAVTTRISGDDFSGKKDTNSPHGMIFLEARTAAARPAQNVQWLDQPKIITLILLVSHGQHPCLTEGRAPQVASLKSHPTSSADIYIYIYIYYQSLASISVGCPYAIGGARGVARQAAQHAAQMGVKGSCWI